MTPEEYGTLLAEHAARAGLADPSLLKQANMLLPPDMAALDLKARYPDSFRASVRDLPRKAYEAAKAEAMQGISLTARRQAEAADLRRLGVA